jgi:hypothetical protein
MKQSKQINFMQVYMLKEKLHVFFILFPNRLFLDSEMNKAISHLLNILERVISILNILHVYTTGK